MEEELGPPCHVLSDLLSQVSAEMKSCCDRKPFSFAKLSRSNISNAKQDDIVAGKDYPNTLLH